MIVGHVRRVQITCSLVQCLSRTMECIKHHFDLSAIHGIFLYSNVFIHCIIPFNPHIILVDVIYNCILSSYMQCYTRCLRPCDNEMSYVKHTTKTLYANSFKCLAILHIQNLCLFKYWSTPVFVRQCMGNPMKMGIGDILRQACTWCLISFKWLIQS